MRAPLPALHQFRVEIGAAGVAHLIFDAPGRSMNVFSNAAIHELGTFAAWLRDSDIVGVVVRSGKASGFCAGADLTELGVAYDMIMATPPEERTRVAFDHFRPLGKAIRDLDTAGKPVAAAIGGIALGGGCELAMGAHQRVVADHPTVALGLPESLVGLLPGAGGTQRLPRLIGVAAALPILLDGERLSAQAALAAGLADQIVEAGTEVAAAEAWVLANSQASQPWDRLPRRSPEPAPSAALLADRRAAVLRHTLGHYPAPLAILDCIEQGLKLPFDDALVVEMRIFSRLIQRPEPRDMIRTLFLAKLDHDRCRKAGALPPAVIYAVESLADRWQPCPAIDEALATGGFTGLAGATPEVPEDAVGAGYWFDRRPDTPGKRALRAALTTVEAAATAFAVNLSEEEQRIADYLLVTTKGFPAYLGGPFALLANRSCRS